jgi:hypothetical protein
MGHSNVILDAGEGKGKEKGPTSETDTITRGHIGATLGNRTTRILCHEDEVGRMRTINSSTGQL